MHGAPYQPCRGLPGRTAYKLAKVGKKLGTVYNATEKEALENAQKEFAKTEKKRIYLRAQ